MNNYNIEITEILKIEKRENKKINTTVLITSTVGLTMMISSIINFSKYSAYILIIGGIIATIGLKYGNKRKKELYNFVEQELYKNSQNIDFKLYKKKPILTKNEYGFYKELKPIAEELNLIVFTKVRIADIVDIYETSKNLNNRHFNKISRKHIDFILTNSEDLEIKLLIELDDSSHDFIQKERDDFVNQLYKTVGYNLIRVKNTKDLKTKIIEAIK